MASKVKKIMTSIIDKKISKDASRYMAHACEFLMADIIDSSLDEASASNKEKR